MADCNTHSAAGIAPACRIPLFMVKGALSRAKAHADARAALGRALAQIPLDNWPLRDAVRDVAFTSGWERFAIGAYDRYAVGSACHE